MKITEYKEPYHHIMIDDFLPNDLYEEVKNSLYNIECDIPSVEPPYERFSMWPACVPLGIDIGEHGYINWDDSDNYTTIVTNYISNFFGFSNISKNYDNSHKIKTISDKFKWTGYYEIARDSFEPHTDNAWDNLINDEYYAGIIKGVLYIGKDDIDYTNYGTILLDNKTRTFSKELEFKPNRLILFDTRDDTLHATDYHQEMRNTDKMVHKVNLSKKATQLQQKRFSFNIEYRADEENLTPDDVSQIYKTIEYPNSKILEWWIRGKRLEKLV